MSPVPVETPAQAQRSMPQGSTPAASAPGPLRAALTSPMVLARLPRAAWRWIALYVGAGSVLITLATALWKAFEEDVGDALTAYLLPDSLASIGRWVFGQLLSGQTQSLMVTATVTSAMLLASLLLFRLKWRIATSIADARALVPDPATELRPRVEVWDEVKLALCFITCQAALFWLGYYEIPALKLTADVLSYLLLFVTWAINFTAPLFQRHGGYYSQTARVLARHPLAALAFGAIFSLPVVIAGFIWKANPGWDPTTAICVLFFATLLCTACAQACGTRLATALFHRFRASRRPHPFNRALTGTVFLLILGGCSWLFTNVVLSVHHKSQILKCDYSADLASTRFDLPSLGDLFDGKVTVGASTRMSIHNPTSFDLEVEENRIEIKHGKEIISTTQLTPFKVPAGQKVNKRLAFKVSTDASTLFEKGRALFKSGWTITLWLKVAQGFELPVYLVK